MENQVLFTDGYRQANQFVKELYIGSSWHIENVTSNMILWQARNETHPQGFLISIGLDYENNPITGIKHGFLSVQNGTSGPIKFDSKGLFEGVDCYMVVDWSVFSLPASQTDLLDGEICFGAVVNMELASDINNSPTIKKYLYEQRLLDVAPTLVPECTFEKQEWEPISPTHTINIGDWDSFVNAINTYNSVRLNLTNDIAITNGLLSSSNAMIALGYGKEIVIQGNNRKVYDYSNCLTNKILINKRYRVPYLGTVSGNEIFVTSTGEMYTLARSNVYRAQGWLQNVGTNICGLLLPDELSNLYLTPGVLDNVYICYRLSYYRYIRKIVGISSNALFFQLGDSSDHTRDPYFLETLTPQTDFFLVNYRGDNDGIVIKAGFLSYPVKYGTLSQSLKENIIYGFSTAKVELNGVSVIGGNDINIRNDAEMYIHDCDISNESGGGVSNYGKLYVENNSFHDIRDCAVRSEMIRDQIENHSPYMKVTGNTFTNIGHYGSNMSAVWNTGRAYIANNEFVNTNYCAIRLGANGADKSQVWRSSLVENNLIHHTSEWIIKRQQLGLQDSGDIYVVANNEMATIRFNRIINSGGPMKNNAIYIDYWAYNVQIYGNIITGTENFYDIDCRDCSVEISDVPNILDSGAHSTTNIFIGYNVCDGYLRIQENTNDNIETGCEFIKNFIIKKNIASTFLNGVENGNTYKGVVCCRDSDGIVTDESGMVASATLISLLRRM